MKSERRRRASNRQTEHPNQSRTFPNSSFNARLRRSKHRSRPLHPAEYQKAPMTCPVPRWKHDCQRKPRASSIRGLAITLQRDPRGFTATGHDSAASPSSKTTKTRSGRKGVGHLIAWLNGPPDERLVLNVSLPDTAASRPPTVTCKKSTSAITSVENSLVRFRSTSSYVLAVGSPKQRSFLQGVLVMLIWTSLTSPVAKDKLCGTTPGCRRDGIGSFCRSSKILRRLSCWHQSIYAKQRIIRQRSGCPISSQLRISS